MNNLCIREFVAQGLSAALQSGKEERKAVVRSGDEPDDFYFYIFRPVSQ
jgi:hypothetical protein